MSYKVSFRKIYILLIVFFIGAQNGTSRIFSGLLTPRTERLVSKEYRLALMAAKKVESKLTTSTSGKIK